MVFSSVLFLFLFLPIVVTLYVLTPRAGKNFILLCASLLFYAWGETFYFLIMLVSIGINYSFGLMVHRYADRKKGALIALGLGVVANLSLLLYFKYANFLAGNVSMVLTAVGAAPREWSEVHLPIGISFFTFQGMSYIIDVYRKDAPVQKNPLHIALYISLFPQLIAGPIVRYLDVANQIVERSLKAEEMAYGVRRFIVGLAKKVLIANTVAVPADAIFGLPTADISGGLAWLGILCYSLQIYFDFSGYSDMAIGLGHMFGFRFLENFQWPYIAQNIREFWRRWHISLSTWFRDYLYVPLGGNRYGARRTYFNLLLVFFLCGLWHGASWSFVVWGLYHGFFLVLERSRAGRWLDALWRPLRHVYVLVVVMIGWVFFRAENLQYGMEYLGVMFGRGIADPLLHPVMKHLQADVMLAIAFGAVASTPLLFHFQGWWQRRVETEAGLLAPRAFRFGLQTAACALLLLLSAMTLSAGTHNPFIYFRF